MGAAEAEGVERLALPGADEGPPDTDDGEPMYRLDDIASHLGMSFEDAEQHLLRMMDNRKQVGLSNDGILTNSNININRVQ